MWSDSSSAVRVRRAEPGDVPALAALVQEVHVFHASALPEVFHSPTEIVLTPEEAARLIAEPGHVWLVALGPDAAVVGYAHAEVQKQAASRLKRASARLHVHAMAVTLAERRRGAGRALLAAVRAEAAARGIEEVSLEVYAFNAAARAFYTSAGFTSLRELLVCRPSGSSG